MSESTTSVPDRDGEESTIPDSDEGVGVGTGAPSTFEPEEDTPEDDD